MEHRTEAVESTKKTLADLLDGHLSVEEIIEIVRKPKDKHRFETLLAIEQERVAWNDPILVVLQENLYVVQKRDKSRIVKCRCGQEFGDYRRNWKFLALVFERDPSDGEVFRGPQAADPEWMILREFYCPGCGAQLDVEAVPPGYPFIFKALPDIDGFYDKHPELLRRLLDANSR
jgi:acetone carboxylase gamma subunit